MKKKEEEKNVEKYVKVKMNTHIDIKIRKKDEVLT